MLTIDMTECIWSKGYCDRSNWLFYVDDKSIYLVDGEFERYKDMEVSETYGMCQIKLGDYTWDEYMPSDIREIMEQRKKIYDKVPQ